MVRPKAAVVLANERATQVFDWRRTRVGRAHMIRIAEVGNVIVKGQTRSSVWESRSYLRLIAWAGQCRNSFARDFKIPHRRSQARRRSRVIIVTVAIVENGKVLRQELIEVGELLLLHKRQNRH